MNRLYASTWARVLANTVFNAGCWLWTGGTRNRYPVMSMRIDGKHTKVDVHRWVAEQVLKRPLHPVEETIEHTCYFTLCICPNCFALMHNVHNAESARARQLGRDHERPMVKLVTEGRFWHPDEPLPF